jgi:hypothetical protein
VSRYPRICFDKLYTLSSMAEHTPYLKYNWVSLLKDQYRMAGFEDVWEREIELWSNIQTERGLVVRMHEEALYTADVRAAINSSGGYLYNKINPNYEIGEQLSLRMPIDRIRCVSQLRLATLRSFYVFVKGKGTWVDSTKICPICNLKECETLEHFLLKCPMYNEVRHAYLSRYFTNVENNEDRLIVLLSNLNVSKVNIIYIYVAKSLLIRAAICSLD